MDDEPDVIKELREAERLGVIQSKAQSAYDESDMLEESSPEIASDEKTFGFDEEAEEIRQKENNVHYERTEKELENSEEKYRLIAENTSDLISMSTFSLNPTYTYVSPSHKKLLGYDPEEMIGKSCFDFIPPTEKKKMSSLLKKYIGAKGKKIFTGKESEVNETIEYRVKDKSGNWHFLESTINIVGNELLFVSKDITKRKKAEEKLKEKIDELERYKKVTVGRELKMTELKDRIKELEGKLKKENEGTRAKITGGKINQSNIGVY